MSFFFFKRSKDSTKPTDNLQLNFANSFHIDDTFNIRGRGIVCTGKVETGIIKVGMIMKLKGKSMSILGIEVFKNMVEVAQQGEEVGLLLENADYDFLKANKNSLAEITSIVS